MLIEVGYNEPSILPGGIFSKLICLFGTGLPFASCRYALNADVEMPFAGIDNGEGGKNIILVGIVPGFSFPCVTVQQILAG